MSVLAELKKAGGCQGGKVIYAAAKLSCQAANVARKDRELWDNTRKLFKKYFPDLNLKKVRFHINCTLPGNWFTSANSVDGMTFGYDIYFKGSDLQKSRKGLRLLMHELVHVDQVRRLGGELAFACKYGEEYVKAGNYRDNRLEVEAYDFVAKHGASLPDGVKK